MRECTLLCAMPSLFGKGKQPVLTAKSPLINKASTTSIHTSQSMLRRGNVCAARRADALPLALFPPLPLPRCSCCFADRRCSRRTLPLPGLPQRKRPIPAAARAAPIARPRGRGKSVADWRKRVPAELTPLCPLPLRCAAVPRVHRRSFWEHSWASLSRACLASLG